MVNFGETIEFHAWNDSQIEKRKYTTSTVSPNSKYFHLRIHSIESGMRLKGQRAVTIVDWTLKQFEIEKKKSHERENQMGRMTRERNKSVLMRQLLRSVISAQGGSQPCQHAETY